MVIGEPEVGMNNIFVRKMFKKLLKLVICTGVLIKIEEVYDFLRNHGRLTFLLIFPIIIFSASSIYECIVNIFHYISVKLNNRPDSDLEDVFTVNLTFFISGSGESNNDMFRPDGSLTHKGKVQVNSILHQRDMYNRSSTHRYYDDKK